MSILSFLDTVYDTAQHSLRYGKPNPLVQGDNKYDYNSLRYPLDIGSADKGHYMVIHINTQTKTQFNPSGYSSENPTVIQNMLELQKLRGVTNIGGYYQKLAQAVGVTAPSTSNITGTQVASTIKNAVNNISTGQNPQPNQTTDNELLQSIGDISDNLTNSRFLRNIRRTTDSVVLYMPDTLNFEYRQNFDELRLSNGLVAAAAGIGSSYDAYKNTGNGWAAGVAAMPFIASYTLSGFNNFGRALTTAGLGLVENPMLELIYSQPTFRNFQFDFMFYPRDEKEALEVQKIIQKLKFHQAPEIKDSSYGYFLIPPSEFDIKFYYNGHINDNIDKISTCVLENVIVNYSPAGFTAYESYGESKPSLGRTGMPVAIQMTLMFKETQILTKESYATEDQIDKIYALRDGERQDVDASFSPNEKETQKLLDAAGAIPSNYTPRTP